MSNEAHEKVDAILAAAGIKYAVAYRGLKRRALGGDRAMDEWEAVFTTGESGRCAEYFEFFTGLGLRSPIAQPWDGGPMPRPGSIMREEMEKARKPVPPHAADVLHSLLLDAIALDLSFDEWCSEYGYDTDSRSAERTFDDCRSNARRLDAVINAETRAALSEALQDY